MSNPYETLGIEPTASDSEIRLAYLKLARTLHPDVAGPESEEQFKRLSEAYDTLRDPEKRSFYDQTGFMPGEDDEYKAALTIASDAVEAVVMNTQSLETDNIIAISIEVLRNNIKELPKQRSELGKQIGKLNKAAKRISRKTGDKNPMSALLLKKTQVLKGRIEQINKAQSVGEKAIILLREYTYKVDIMQQDEFIKQLIGVAKGNPDIFHSSYFQRKW